MRFPLINNLQIEVTKEEFFQYEEVRVNSLYNMLSKNAMQVSGLEKAKYMYILSNYVKLKNYYLNDNEIKE